MWFPISRSLLLFVALATSVSHADFGDYRAHEHLGNTLTMTTTRGQLRIKAVDDAAFEVHYIEQGVKQLPSFALAPKDRDFVAAATETESSVAFRVDGLTAVIDKSPVRVSFLRDGRPLVEEEHGYFAHETVRCLLYKSDAADE